jgi:hypothetical protein
MILIELTMRYLVAFFKSPIQSRKEKTDSIIPFNKLYSSARDWIEKLYYKEYHDGFNHVPDLCLQGFEHALSWAFHLYNLPYRIVMYNGTKYVSGLTPLATFEEIEAGLRCELDMGLWCELDDDDGEIDAWCSEERMAECLPDTNTNTAIDYDE